MVNDITEDKVLSVEELTKLSPRGKHGPICLTTSQEQINNTQANKSIITFALLEKKNIQTNTAFLRKQHVKKQCPEQIWNYQIKITLLLTKLMFLTSKTLNVTIAYLMP